MSTSEDKLDMIVIDLVNPEIEIDLLMLSMNL